jgi:hypothetical protein
MLTHPRKRGERGARKKKRVEQHLLSQKVRFLTTLWLGMRNGKVTTAKRYHHWRSLKIRVFGGSLLSAGEKRFSDPTGKSPYHVTAGKPQKR